LGRHYGLFTDKVEHNLMQSWEEAVTAVTRERLAREQREQPSPEGDPVVPSLMH
jgi:hypothetical protein